MNKLLRSMLALSGVLAGGLSANAAAISQATLPYEFIANGVKMPAGKYRVEALPGAVRLTDMQSGSVTLVPQRAIRSTAGNKKTQLIMKRSGQDMHLVAVREGGSTRMRVLDTRSY